MSQTKIGLMGVQSGGKTTTLLSLAGELKTLTKTVNIVQETARDARLHGFKLDMSATIDTQLWITGKQFCEELEAQSDPVDFILCDRPVFDSIIYTWLNPTISMKDKFLIKNIAFNYARIKPYTDLLYFSPLNAPPQNDGVRNTDPEFQQRIDTAFRSLIDEMEKKQIPIKILESKDKKERVREAINYVIKRYVS